LINEADRLQIYAQLFGFANLFSNFLGKMSSYEGIHLIGGEGGEGT
jgi:hypothetical protein